MCSIHALGFPALALLLAQATTVPTEVQLPGTQPLEVMDLIAPTHCDNCHGGYDPVLEPAHTWRGSMMSQAATDPLFWATVAIAEQDFEGVGDLCLRCHVAKGWLAGNSTPTDGSGLSDAEATSVSCHLCHKMADPDGTAPVGVQNAPFIANDGGTPAEGYYGNGMFVVNYSNLRFGPYDDADANHAFAEQPFIRSVDYCGTCHDVSNPVVGDLAHNNGSMTPLAAGTFSGVPGSPVDGKAAFNNLPFMYGIVERTFSEYKASAVPETLVSSYASLPPELQDGAFEYARDAALTTRPDGNFANGEPRYFSCQTCHMVPTTGPGCDKMNAPIRTDLGVHDLTGGNYWVPEATVYLDNQDRLALGSVSTVDAAGLADGRQRAIDTLRRAASLEVTGNTVRVVNLTGHKLISGYPEGRRMWLNVKWFDAGGTLVDEDGSYGTITAMINGFPLPVRTLLDLHAPGAKVYEAHFGITQEWAAQLIALGYSTSMPLHYDRTSGAVTLTLGQIAAQAPGTAAETFHFALNNQVLMDNRIPPYGMRYDDSLTRNVLPVPSTQFGSPGPGGVFEHWDDVLLDPPLNAVTAEVRLMYQPTSWEYIQFLDLSNNGVNPFFADLGDAILEAWLNTGMAEPEVMASTTWALPTTNWTRTCIGDGTGIPCPCGNDSVLGSEEGCLNSSGLGALLDVSGDASVSADTLVLTVNQATPSQNGVFVQNTTPTAGIPFYDGVFCLAVDSHLVRHYAPPTILPTTTDAAGTGVNAQPLTAGDFVGDTVPGATVHYQFWHRDPAGPCTTGANFSSGVSVTWGI